MRCSFRVLSLLAAAAPAPAFADTTAAKLWEANCASCHGVDGSGNSASSLLDDDWTTDGTDRGLYASIEGGLKHLGMPGYADAFTPAEIWSQVVHVRELRAQAERDANPEAVAEPGTGGVAEGTGVYATERARFRLEEVDLDLDGFERPWAIDFLPDGRPLVTERSGTLYVLGEDGPVVVSGTPEVWNHGQGGLLDVAVDPGYAENGWVYLSFSQSSGERGGKAVGNTVFVRGKLRARPQSDGQLAWAEQQVVHRPDEADDGPSGVHFGSRFAFDPGDAGRVFVALGERGRNEAALDPGVAVGKVLRLNADGSAPADRDRFASETDAVRGLWSLGHRNPQALLFQPGTGRLYGIEHGPRGGDEVNLIEPGMSYGWSTHSYSINYSGTPRGENAPWHAENGHVEPVFTWLPSIAPCGAAFYEGEASEGAPAAFPDWSGDLFVTSLVKQELHRLRLSEDGRSVIEREVLLRGIGRLRDIATGPGGALWILAEKPGRVFRLTPAD